jgi:hypothetical protein
MEWLLVVMINKYHEAPHYAIFSSLVLHSSCDAKYYLSTTGCVLFIVQKTARSQNKNKVAVLCNVILTIYIHSFIHSFIHSSIHSSIHPLIHSFIHSRTNSFIHPFTHPFIHLFTHPFIHSFIHSSIHSSIHPLIHSFIHSRTNSFIHPFIHLFTHPFIHPFTHPFVHPFTHPFIHPFTHPFIRSFIPQSALRQVRSPFQSEFSTQYDLVLPLSISSNLSFPQGHPVAAYVFFLVFSSLLSFPLSIHQ